MEKIEVERADWSKDFKQAASKFPSLNNARIKSSACTQHESIIRASCYPESLELTGSRMNVLWDKRTETEKQVISPQVWYK
jgi:hypothetical protein